MLSQSLGLHGQRSQHNIQPSVGLGGLGAIPFLRKHARIVACFGRNVWRPWVVSRSRTFLCHHTSGYGLVAMTFASHAKGREFNPHYPYFHQLALGPDSPLMGRSPALESRLQMP